MTDENTKRIGDYEILGVLGAGGMGKVFKVRNVISDRIEAMKILLPDLAGRQDLANRFLREIKVLAALDHPNIAALRTALTLGNQLVMVMEFVEGTTLATRLEPGPIPPAEALNYIGQVLDALNYAHSRNVIHRDIKPANMMLTPAGLIKLMDFGIARSADDHSLTTTGTTLGSLYYMSPEQVKGAPTDARSDLYSVGVSLYEMVTGERPFRGTSDFSLMAAQVQQAPIPPIELRSDLSLALSEIILTAMAKEPAQRFQSAAAFRNALNNVRTPTPAGASAKSPVAEPSAGVAATAFFQGPTAASVAPMAATPQSPSYGSQGAPPAQVESVPSAAQLSGQASTHRGLYMTLGALIVLAGLVAAGLYVPRWSKAGASGSNKNLGQEKIQINTDQGNQSTQQSQQNSGQQGQNSSGIDQNTNQGSQISTQQGQGQSGSGAGTSQQVQQSGSGGIQKAAQKEKVDAIEVPVKTKQHVSDLGSTSVQTGNGTHADQTSSGQTVPEGQAAELEQLEQEMDQLSSRATAVDASMETLRQQQSAQGVGLRGDIASTQELMKSHITRAQMAVRNQDAKNARKYLDLAEPEVSALEKFLGR